VRSTLASDSRLIRRVFHLSPERHASGDAAVTAPNVGWSPDVTWNVSTLERFLGSGVAVGRGGNLTHGCTGRSPVVLWRSDRPVI
jgi:hypothetical protein